MARTLLFLSAESFSASIWQAGNLTEQHSFSYDSDGRERFSTFLKTHRNPTYLLVDVIEEDFRLETVPHLTGSARQALLERKYEQYYRNIPFRQATLLHRQSEGRRDDEMLFSALTNPQRISPWLDALLANHIPLVGIYSVPNIGAPILKDIASDHVLLLTWEKDAGLRQTYYNAKRLHFSRLIPVNNSSFCELVASETPRTLQYLKSLSLPPAGESLEIYIVCTPSDHQTIQSHLEYSNELSYTFLDVRELGQRFKSKYEFTDSDATPLLLHLLASKPPTSHYANAEHTHFHSLAQLRRMFYLLAATTVLIGGVWAGLSLSQASNYFDEAGPLRSQAERMQQQSDNIHRGFSNTTVPANDMKSAVLMWRKLRLYSPPPADILRELTLTLDDFPQIQPSKLAWNSSGNDAPPSSYPAQLIEMEGKLTGFESNYRGTLGYLNDFKQALEQRGYTVSISKQPVDISSAGSISGKPIDAKSNAAEFALKIIWRLKE